MPYIMFRLQLLLLSFFVNFCIGKIASNYYNKILPGGSCMTPSLEEGNCVHWKKCELMTKKLRSWDQLRPYMCGQSGFQPRICCPSFPQPDTTTPSADTKSTITNPGTTDTTLEDREMPLERRINFFESTDDSNSKPVFLPDKCGSTVFTLNRVFGGQKAEKGSWPWMVALFHVQTRSLRSFVCGGALVTAKHVVTAAHCVVKRDSIEPLSPKKLLVRVGAHDLSKDSEPGAIEVHVDDVRVHQDYDFRRHTGDIAVLLLSQSVPFSNHTSPVCLPYDSLFRRDLSGKGAVVTGFGITSPGGNYSNILMQASFDIQDLELCKEIYERDIPKITNGHLCAGPLDGTKDSCQGDSGGPLVTIGKGKRFYLVGVVSFGKKCSLFSSPGVYTRITKYLDWLTPKLAD